MTSRKKRCAPASPKMRQHVEAPVGNALLNASIIGGLPGAPALDLTASIGAGVSVRFTRPSDKANDVSLYSDLAMRFQYQPFWQQRFPLKIGLNLIGLAAHAQGQVAGEGSISQDCRIAPRPGEAALRVLWTQEAGEPSQARFIGHQQFPGGNGPPAVGSLADLPRSTPVGERRRLRQSSESMTLGGRGSSFSALVTTTARSTAARMPRACSRKTRPGESSVMPLGVAGKEWSSDLVLERPNVPAYGRLRHAEALRSAAHVALLRHCDEVSNLRQAHVDDRADPVLPGQGAHGRG